MATIGVEKLARALNLTRSRIAQLVHEGMPKEARGQYDFFKCGAWYVRYLQRAIERRIEPTLEESAPGELGERNARIRLLKVQADMKEDLLTKERARLVSVEDVEREKANLIRVTTARIMAIPPRLALELVGETQRTLVQAKIERAIKQALSDLAKTRFAETAFYPAASATGDGDAPKPQ